jgi:predicted Zn finger-like uncharacterized protein
LVVVCDKCETRFKLGDSQVPAEGTRVRCSRCKHEFFVRPAGSGDAEVVDEVLADVAGAVPEAEERAGDFEEDWEFNDDSQPHVQVEAGPELREFSEFDAGGIDFSSEAPELADSPELAGAPELAEAPASVEPPVSVEAPPPEIATREADPVEEPEPDVFPVSESPLDPVESIRARDAAADLSSPDDLGSPEEWDFVGSADAEPPLEFIEDDDTAGPSFPSVDESGSASPSAELEESPAAAPSAEEEPPRTPLAARLADLASIAGWLAVALAFSVGLSPSLTRPGGGGAEGAAPGEISVSGVPITASEVEGRLVENALAGNLLVVSGRLENTGSSAVIPGQAVTVQLVDAGGVPISGATAAAGHPVGEKGLRERDPDRLRLELEHSAAEMARRPLRPGARVPFDAVFESIPESAAGWVLETASSASHPDPASSLLPTALPAWE